MLVCLCVWCCLFFKPPWRSFSPYLKTGKNHARPESLDYFDLYKQSNHVSQKYFPCFHISCENKQILKRAQSGFLVFHTLCCMYVHEISLILVFSIFFLICNSLQSVLSPLHLCKLRRPHQVLYGNKRCR